VFGDLAQRAGRAFCLTVVFASAAFTQRSRYFRVGNAGDAQARTRGGIALMGGGPDLDEAFKWMCTQSGGGDFLVLRARGDEAYNRYIQDLCQINSVATLIIPDREAAREPRIAVIIRQAEAVFIAGGDQANYVNGWSGTPVEEAINDAIRRGVPVGGTSAGLAVLGEFAYSAQNDGPNDPNLTSARSLANPYDRQVTIVRGFLTSPLMKGVITDSHLTARDRLGRLLVFMARIMQDQGIDEVKAMGVDERTAVLVDSSGQAEVVGAGSAYFLRATHKPEVCRPGASLTFDGIEMRHLRAGEQFNLASWSGSGGKSGLISVEGGIVRSGAKASDLRPAETSRLRMLFHGLLPEAKSASEGVFVVAETRAGR
jgi:cyanophycinase